MGQNSRRTRGKKGFQLVFLSVISLAILELVITYNKGSLAGLDFIFYSWLLFTLWISLSYWAMRNSSISLVFVPFIAIEIVLGFDPAIPIYESFQKTMILLTILFADIVSLWLLLEYRYSRRIKKRKKPQYQEEIREVLRELEYLEPPV